MEIEYTHTTLSLSINQNNQTNQIHMKLINPNDSNSENKEIISENEPILMALEIDHNEIYFGQQKKDQQNQTNQQTQMKSNNKFIQNNQNNNKNNFNKNNTFNKFNNNNNFNNKNNFNNNKFNQNKNKKRDSIDDLLGSFENETYFSTFIDDLISSPNEFKWNSIDYQNKEYNFVSESLFALVIHSQKKLIEKIQPIDSIQNVVIDIPCENNILKTKLKRALKMIGFSFILTEEENEQMKEFENTFERQELLIKELLSNHKIYLKMKKQIIESKKIMMEEDNKYRCTDLMTININNEYSSERIQKLENSMKSSFGFKLNKHAIMLVTNYFETFNDFVNLEKGCKKFRGICEKCKHNSISLNDKTIKFFPNLTSLHLYSPDDKKIETRKIQQFVYWKIGYYDYQNIKTLPNCVFKKVVYSKNDRNRDYKQAKGKKEGYKHDFILPDEIVEIDKECFANYANIKSIIIPTTVIKIGDGCFTNCKTIESITIPQSIVVMGENIFNGCSSLTEVKLPELMTELPDKYLSHLGALKRIILPETITRIGNKCFFNCKSLEEIEIPKSVEIIESDCFYGCSKLTHITLELNEKRVVYGNKIFNNQVDFDMLYLPSSIKKINENEVEQLTSMTIPSFVTSINKNCFKECKSIKELFVPSSLSTFKNEWITECTALTKIELQEGILSLENKAFSNCKMLKVLEIPSTVTSIGSQCFNKCINLQEITIHSSIKVVRNDWFNECISLSSIHLINGIETIEENAFDNLQALQEISIPSSIQTVKKYLFDNCTSLTKIILEEGIHTIEDEAFKNYESLCEIELPSTLTSIGKKCFKNCLSLQQIKLPNSIQSIDSLIFEGCTSLTSIELSSSMTEIPDDCFKDLISLQSIVIPESIKSVGKKVFANCQSLSELTLPTTVEYLGYSCFTNCKTLTNISISDQFTLQGNRLFFEQNQILYSCELPNSLKQINSKKIRLSELDRFEIPTTVTAIGKYCFVDCFDLSELIIPDTLKEVHEGSLFNCPQLSRDEYNQIINSDQLQLHLEDNQRETLEKWTNKEFGEIVFDSEFFDWKINKSEFSNCTLNKISLIYIIHTTENEIFGGYIPTLVEQTNEPICDSYAFIFAFKNNQSFKFDIRKERNKPKGTNACQIFSKESTRLIKFGTNDLNIGKEGETSSIHEDKDSSYEYKGNKEGIVEKGQMYQFIPKRIIVVQME